MSDLIGDLRFALRSFRRSPLHALATVLILGVGIGAVTLMFSVLNASVLRPLPFPHPDRLVWLWKASDQVRQNSVSYDDFEDYRASLDAMEDVAAYQLFYPRLLLSGTEEATRVLGNQVTPNLFSVLGVAPTLGRGFRWEEAVDGGPDVTILSHAFWRGRFGADPSIVGRTISLNGRPTEVVGVMPEGFEFPASGVQLWLPSRKGESATQGRGNNNFFVIGRLKDGVSLAAAQAQVEAVAARIQAANPDYAAWYHWLQPLHTVLFGNTRTVLLLLLGIVALVPLVACANVASLALARATARTNELATRRALGAGRSRIVRQLVVENVLLALLGGALGLLIAQVGGRLLRSVGPASIPRLSEIGVDPTVLSFALLVSLLTVPLFGVVPALRGAGFDLAGALRFGAGRGGPARRGWSRSALVVTQVALSMTLLVTSGMLYRSLSSIDRVDPGFEVGSLLTAGVELPAHKYASPEELDLAWDLTLRRLRGIPGVQGVAAADWLPVTPGGGPWNGLSRPGRGEGTDQDQIPGRRKFVSRDYFRVLGIPILAGRSFQEDDGIGSEPVMILSETLASSLFPGEDPLGQPVILWDQPFRVVGVSAKVDEAGLGDEGRPAFFVSADQYPRGGPDAGGDPHRRGGSPGGGGRRACRAARRGPGHRRLRGTDHGRAHRRHAGAASVPDGPRERLRAGGPRARRSGLVRSPGLSGHAAPPRDRHPHGGGGRPRGRARAHHARGDEDGRSRGGPGAGGGCRRIAADTRAPLRRLTGRPTLAGRLDAGASRGGLGGRIPPGGAGREGESRWRRCGPTRRRRPSRGAALPARSVRSKQRGEPAGHSRGIGVVRQEHMVSGPPSMGRSPMARRLGGADALFT